MSDQRRATIVLIANTLAFMVCVAVWLMNGVLATFLDTEGVIELSQVQVAWLLGAPVLTGSLLRLPAGMLTDRFGGRPVFTIMMVLAAIATFLTSYANDFWGLFAGSLGFGITGATFAVGVAYSSVWVSKDRQGTALGVFGAGNVGTAVTAMIGPALLDRLTRAGESLEGWRAFPRLYAAALLVTAVAFWLVTVNRRPETDGKTFLQRLTPLREVRVWRFGLYYFFAFGGFVALSQWLIPYYVNVYTLGLAAAGFLAALFSLPAAAVRILGGWLSDVLTARTVMYISLGASLVLLVLLFPPRMHVQTPGPGIAATEPGVVREVTDERIVVNGDRYALVKPGDDAVVELGPAGEEVMFILPKTTLIQEPVVEAGDEVVAGQLLAKGVTHAYFQAHMRIFSGIVFVLAIAMGFGAAAVYAHIPRYYPADVGVVGGVVGVLGALGGFVHPIVFGYLLEWSGIWSSAWMYLFVLALVSLVWMHMAIVGSTREPPVSQGS